MIPQLGSWLPLLRPPSQGLPGCLLRLTHEGPSLSPAQAPPEQQVSAWPGLPTPPPTCTAALLSGAITTHQGASPRGCGLPLLGVHVPPLQPTPLLLQPPPPFPATTTDLVTPLPSWTPSPGPSLCPGETHTPRSLSLNSAAPPPAVSLIPLLLLCLPHTAPLWGAPSSLPHPWATVSGSSA